MPDANKKTLRSFSAVSSVLIFVIVTISFFCVMEGAFSVIYIADNYMRFDLSSHQKHTQFDELLGWDNIPGLAIENYVDNGHLAINSQKTRNNRDFSFKVPPGKKRVICSGDSFTFGKGVSNDYTWCSQLESITPELEAVNMGQEGYSFGQSYLKYRRDSKKFQHDIHVIAFITDDFHRMRSDKFGGMPKPFLKLKNSKIVVDNLPLPSWPAIFPRLFHNIDSLKRLRTVQFFNERILKNDASSSSNKKSEIKEIVRRIVQELKKDAAQNGISLLFVYLPNLEADRYEKSQEWELFFHELMRSENINYLNLLQDFRWRLAEWEGEEKRQFFLDHGHYNNLGNSWASRAIHAELKQLGFLD